jgi:methionyl-tRNA formyltransferase
MKVYLVVEETVFFHPQFVENLIINCKDEIVGASLVTAVKKKNNIERYMIEHFYYLHLSEIFIMGILQIRYMILSKLDKKKRYTVRSVLNHYQIPFEEVKYNINTDDHIAYIESKKPDVILSSQSLYFGKRILEIPKKCCINRHSGLLPRNGGLWPGFQAVRKGETETGVSVHTMEKTIDAGVILSQVRVPIKEGETVWNIYKECFEKSVDAVIEALKKISENDYSSIDNGYEREYYSFPSKEQWQEFRKRGGKYV